MSSTTLYLITRYIGGCCHHGDNILHPCIISLLLIMQHLHQKTHKNQISITALEVAMPESLLLFSSLAEQSLDQWITSWNFIDGDVNFRELSLDSSSFKIHLCTHLHHGRLCCIIDFSSWGKPDTMPLCLLVVVRTLTPE